MQHVFRQRKQNSVTGAFARGTTCFVDIQQVFRQRKQNSVTGAFARSNVILFHSPSPLTLKSIAEVQDGEPSILWGEKKISTWEKLSLGFGSSISVT